MHLSIYRPAFCESIYHSCNFYLPRPVLLKKSAFYEVLQNLQLRLIEVLDNPIEIQYQHCRYEMTELDTLVYQICEYDRHISVKRKYATGRNYERFDDFVCNLFNSSDCLIPLIEQVMPPRMRLIFRRNPASMKRLCDLVFEQLSQESLYQQFLIDLKQAFPVNKNLLKMSDLFAPSYQKRSSCLSLLWKNEKEYQRLFTELHPLSQLFFHAHYYLSLRNSDSDYQFDLKAFKSLLFKKGLTRSMIRFIFSVGDEFFNVVWQTLDDYQKYFDQAVEYLLWLQELKFKHALPDSLISALNAELTGADTQPLDCHHLRQSFSSNPSLGLADSNTIKNNQL